MLLLRTLGPNTHFRGHFTKSHIQGDDGRERCVRPAGKKSALFRHSSGRYFWAGNLATNNCRANLPRWPLAIAEVDARSLKPIHSSVLTVDAQRPEDKTRGRLDLSHLTLLEDRENQQIILTYPRSYNGYKSNEWATVRLAVK